MVEHRIARLVQLGIRQARYLGRLKTELQLLLAAAVANLTLRANAGSATTSSDSDMLWLICAAIGLLAVLVSHGQGPQRPIGVLETPGSYRTTAHRRQPAALPTARTTPGSRPGL